MLVPEYSTVLVLVAYIVRVLQYFYRVLEYVVRRYFVVRDSVNKHSEDRPLYLVLVLVRWTQTWNMELKVHKWHVEQTTVQWSSTMYSGVWSTRLYFYCSSWYTVQ